MVVYSFQHVGGPLNGTIVDVIENSDGFRRLEARVLRAKSSGAGTGSLSAVTPRGERLALD